MRFEFGVNMRDLRSSQPHQGCIELMRKGIPVSEWVDIRGDKVKLDNLCYYLNRGHKLGMAVQVMMNIPPSRAKDYVKIRTPKTDRWVMQYGDGTFHTMRFVELCNWYGVNIGDVECYCIKNGMRANLIRLATYIKNDCKPIAIRNKTTYVCPAYEDAVEKLYGEKGVDMLAKLEEATRNFYRLDESVLLCLAETMLSKGMSSSYMQSENFEGMTNLQLDYLVRALKSGNCVDMYFEMGFTGMEILEVIESVVEQIEDDTVCRHIFELADIYES